MEVADGDLLVARLWRWDAERLAKDAEVDYAEQVAEGVSNPDYSVSTWAMVKVEDVATEDLMQELCAHVRQYRDARWVTFTTQQRLEASGFKLRQSGPYDRHFDVVIGTELDLEAVERLAEVFGAEQRRRFPECS
jgi:hypothetical protein